MLMFKTHVFTSLRDSAEVTSKIQQNNLDVTLEEVIEALREGGKIWGMRVKNQTDTEAFFVTRG